MNRKYIFTAIVCILSLGLMFDSCNIDKSFVPDRIRSNITVVPPNPVSTHADDPWVIYDEIRDCYYYVWSGDGVRIAKMSEFFEWDDAHHPLSYMQAWRPQPGTELFNEVWAPEIHFINGKYYIYVTAGGGVHHRMQVLESKTDDPMDGFNYMGELLLPENKWAIDGTILHSGGKMYHVWSGWEGYVNVRQDIYIAEMDGPLKVIGNRVMISKPEYPWEINFGLDWPTVNEGPCAVVAPNGLVHIMYSASGSWRDDYCIGLLTLTGADPLNASHWTKKDIPILAKEQGMYGPGHNGVVKSRDGRQWITYHANLISGTGWNGRMGWVRELTWDDDGYPVILPR